MQNPRRETNDEDTERMNGITNEPSHDCFLVLFCSICRIVSLRRMYCHLFVGWYWPGTNKIDFFSVKFFIVIIVENVRLFFYLSKITSLRNFTYFIRFITAVKNMFLCE